MLDQSRSCCCLMPLTVASPEEGGRAQTYEPSVVAGGGRTRRGAGPRPMILEWQLQRHMAGCPAP